MTEAPSILPLTLREVSFEAGGKRLIKDISCTFTRGPRTVIIGPNGAGKSLLLRLCHGLLNPSAGKITWHGTSPAAARRAQAMVFQRPIMLRRSVAANVTYALALKRVPRAARRAIVEEVLTHTGLWRLATHPARVLSFGEQQKLALARAWALRPQILFLDEPTASLDPAASHGIEALIQAIHDAGTKIVMTTHDLGQARRIADEVLFLHRGRILEQAPAEKFFAGPRNDLAAAFIRGQLLWWNSENDHHAGGKRSPPRKNVDP